MMNTTFYLSNNTYYSTTTSFSTLWHKTDGADRKNLYTYQANSAETVKGFSEMSGSPINILTRQYYSPVIIPQTLSGQVSGQLYTSETNSKDNLFGVILIKVVDTNGVWVSNLYSGTMPTEYAVSTKTNRYFPAQINFSSCTLTGDLIWSGYWVSGSGTSGDPIWVTGRHQYSRQYRIVAEYGALANNTSQKASGRHYYSDVTGWVNAPVNETDTNPFKNPWLAFDQQILFY